MNKNFHRIDIRFLSLITAFFIHSQVNSEEVKFHFGFHEDNLKIYEYLSQETKNVTDLRPGAQLFPQCDKFSHKDNNEWELFNFGFDNIVEVSTKDADESIFTLFGANDIKALVVTDSGVGGCTLKLSIKQL